MIYNKLAEIYDELVGDPSAVKIWADFVEQQIPKKRILELACGSGAITSILALQGYRITAIDQSTSMIEQAKKKITKAKVEFIIGDMSNYHLPTKYDGIICFCDSINYLIEESDLQRFFHLADYHLTTSGILLFDMHHPMRLLEFAENWQESGEIAGYQYQWMISTEEDKIIQYFNLQKAGKSYQEEHIQRVYPVEKIREMLADEGFSVEVFNDYDIFNEDLQERLFIKATKS